MSIFKAYDIRGVYNKDFTKEDVYKIGLYLPKLLCTDKILVGRDIRNSSEEIFSYLSNGITDSGCDVYDLGLASTPMVYFFTGKYNFKGSIQITASHNPKEYNGLKISKKNVLPVGYDTGLSELERFVQTNGSKRKPKQKGKIIKFKKKEEYIIFLRKYLNKIDNLKVGIDCSNGMTGLILNDIFNFINAKFINTKMDGDFPGHSPNPLREENSEQLKKIVKEEKLDVGILFDGDGDRVVFIDERGRFIQPDLIIASLGHYFLKNEKGRVLCDIRTSRSVLEYIENLGGYVYIWKVGHAFAKLKLREIEGIYGGELAGHYYIRDFFYCDSGILTSIFVLNILSEFKQKGIKFSDLIDRIKKYENTGEVNFLIYEKEKAIQEVFTQVIKKYKIPLKVLDFDGYRIEYKDWWFNIRKSNTEPYLRLVVEAKSKKLLDEKFNFINRILQKFK